MGDALERGDDEAAASRGRGVPPVHDGAGGPRLRILAVNGDDFGFSRGVNRAILDAHDRGIVTSASLMVTGAAADEAVAIARSRPTLAVGLHLALVDARPALAPADVPHLVGRDGRFSASPTRAGLRYAFSDAARRELRREVRAQLEAFRATGLPLSHVDGHLHLHVHPVVLAALAKLASEYAIPAVRLPREELSTALALDRSHIPTKLLWAAIFRAPRRRGERLMRAAGVAVADRVYGLFQTGRIDERYLLALLPRMRGDRVEIYAHPALEIVGERRNGPPGAGPRELEAVVSPRVRAAVEASGFRLAPPRDFAAATAAALGS